MKSAVLFVCGMLFLFVALLSGMSLLIEILLWLAIGWLLFLLRDMPLVHFNRSAILAAIVFSAVFTFGLHLWLARVWREWKQPELPTDCDTRHGLSDQSRRQWPWRWTIAAAAIILFFVVAGVSTVAITHQLAWLATTKVPLTISRPDYYLKAQSSNRLKQLGIALSPFVPERGELPPGASVDDKGYLLHGWQTLILPYMEQPQLADRVDLNQPWYTTANRAVFATRVDVYGTLSERYGTEPADNMAPSVYSGNSRLLGGTRRWKHDEITDGLSYTVVAGEVVGSLPAWGRPGNWRDPADGLVGDDSTFGSPWKKGVNFLLADGSVQTFDKSIDPAVLRCYATPDDGDRPDVEAR